jgi:hypothetical protein
MSNVLYSWEEGKMSLSLSIEDGQLRVDADDGFHDTVLMLPAKEAPKMSAALLMSDANPLVMHFATPEDRAEFVAQVHAINETVKQGKGKKQ